jgi:hypothetical protein
MSGGCLTAQIRIPRTTEIQESPVASGCSGSAARVGSEMQLILERMRPAANERQGSKTWMASRFGERPPADDE